MQIMIASTETDGDEPIQEEIQKPCMNRIMWFQKVRDHLYLNT